MNIWPDIRAAYAAWLRTFPMVDCIGNPGDTPEVIDPADEPTFLDTAFWSERTHAAEWVACRYLSDTQIDAIFDEVAAVIDENLQRFDPLVAYFARFAPDGDPTRIAWEREAAHSIKRDLAWAACEKAVGEPGFFCGLLPWYERGRWPVGWLGQYPSGHVRVV